MWIKIVKAGLLTYSLPGLPSRPRGSGCGGLEIGGDYSIGKCPGFSPGSLFTRPLGREPSQQGTKISTYPGNVRIAGKNNECGALRRFKASGFRSM